MLGVARLGEVSITLILQVKRQRVRNCSNSIINTNVERMTLSWRKKNRKFIPGVSLEKLKHSYDWLKAILHWDENKTPMLSWGQVTIAWFICSAHSKGLFRWKQKSLHWISQQYIFWYFPFDWEITQKLSLLGVRLHKNDRRKCRRDKVIRLLMKAVKEVSELGCYVLKMMSSEEI